ncbi:MAG: SGNH/GDSL hydrolase family protein [Victivallaceae bacterium]|nr:SGNH/GDSL hydrolase family protein [Victivallaceae bacterium]
MRKKLSVLVAVAVLSPVFSPAADVDYRKYQIHDSSRAGESIEWSTSYVYNRLDVKSQRVLLVGDSICNGYQPVLRNMLADKCNISFWASSYCVSDPIYLRQLDAVLSGPKPDIVIFNNGLHSLVSNKDEWYEAYVLAVKFIQAKFPDAQVVLLNCTKLRSGDPKVDEINELTADAASELRLPLLDIHSVTDAMPKGMWKDAYHFNGAGIKRQAEFLAGEISSRLKKGPGKVVQKGTATGPSGELK